MSVCRICKVKGIGTLFRVPSNEKDRNRWSEICGVSLSQSARICSKHFLSSNIVKAGSKLFLMASADPCSSLFQQINSCDVEEDVKPNIFSVSDNEGNTSSLRQKNVPEPRTQPILQQQNPVIKRNLPIIPPQLEEPIVHLPQVKLVKSVSCSECTQTNTRLCGLVEASDLGDDFRFNCFYCPQVFPLDKWRMFVKHLKESHFKEEEAFQTSKYLSKEHDYTPITLPTALVKTELETISYITAPPTVEDPLGSVQNPFESVGYNSNLYYNKTNYLAQRPRQRKNMNINRHKKGSKRMVKSSNRFYSKLSQHQTSQRSALSRCLKRTIEEKIEPTIFNSFEEDDENFDDYETKPFSADPENPTEISFEYSPRPVVNLLLDSMKKYTVLWQFDNEPFNEDFFEAVEELCNIVNNKFFLNIDNLKMRRSINRILRFYCHLYPNENNHPLTYYYDKCAAFLPSVNEIAYARCPHCYICYESDFDLRLHLVEEQRYLEWPYKCGQCKECFRLWDESVLHKHLPHYDEIFRCEPCKLSFFRRLSYKKHMVEEHQKVNDPGRFKCDLCDKTLETYSGLRNHKKTHGDRQHKCHLCPKAFHAKSRLELHLKIHRQEPDFMCEVCGKKFYMQPALKVHMTKHTGEKVTCKICGIRLRKSSLSRHLRIFHVATTGPDVKTLFSKGKQICLGRLLKTRSKAPPTKKKRGLERSYTCKICELSFDNYKLVAQHNKELHATLPMWPCKICSTEYNAKINLKRHYRRKHKLHALQTYKLVEEQEDLDVVLAIDLKEIDEIYESLKNARYDPASTKLKNLSRKSNDDEELPTESTKNRRNVSSESNEEEEKGTPTESTKIEIVLLTPDDKFPAESSRTKNTLIKSDDDDGDGDDDESPTKAALLSEDMYFSEEKYHSSAIQDEIMKAVDDIETEDIKIDYINDIFTDILD